MAGVRSAATPDAEALAEFADALRQLRREAGNPGYRVLARRTGYGTTTLWEATSGRTVPTLAVTLAYVAACGGDAAEWERRWQRLVESRDDGPVEPAVAPEPVRPHQLPFDVYGFTGRSNELSRLDALLDETAEGAAPAVVISAVSGTAGVGKTALAVHWAHRVADRFPDGELYLDMRGYDPDQPVQPADALAASLRALGLDGNDIPEELAERAARYRTLLANRRMLLVLDNVYSVDQVRPLLPGTGTCFVVVTSRDSLAGLVVRHGARRIDLDLLSSSEALALLRTLVGERVDAEPEAALAMVEWCARLPLALRIAAELIASRPTIPLKQLVAELADERGRLDRLEMASDDRTAVRAVFSWSYQQLPVEAARTFRLLGLHPGPDIDRYAVAALDDVDLDTARQSLDVLVRANLIQESAPGRYSMHDLLRAYSAERADAEAAEDRRAALTRLLHHYLSAAGAAMDVLFPAERHRRPRPPVPVGPVPPVELAAQARVWLDAERVNLVAAIGYAADHGWPTQAGYLAATVARYLELATHYTDALTVHGHALQAAREHGDHYSQSMAYLNLGQACYYLGRYEEAAGHFQRAATGFRQESDGINETRAATNLGVMYAQLGRYDEALAQYQRALVLAREVGDRVQATVLLGWVGHELGRQGRYDEGIDHLQRALTGFREIDFPMREAEVLTDLAEVHLWAGRYEDVLRLTDQALAIERRHGNPYGETHALNIQAEGQRARGRFDEALGGHRAALDLGREIDHREDQARALDGIATILHAQGELAAAREHWREALDLYTALRMPRADEVRARLNSLT
jgi:tetratricopeptide (TPR) repeat protein